MLYDLSFCRVITSSRNGTQRLNTANTYVSVADISQ